MIEASLNIKLNYASRATRFFGNHALDPDVKVYVGKSTKYESSLSSITKASIVPLVSSISDDQNIAVIILDKW